MDRSSVSSAPTATESATLPARWSIALPCVIVLALGVAYFGVFERLVAIWLKKADYSHGFVVPFVAAVFVWMRRDSIMAAFRANLPMGAVLSGVSMIGLGAAIRIVGIFGRALPLEGYSIVFIAAGLALTCCGFSIFWRLLPASLFLVFMVPLPGSVSRQLRGELQGVATKISVFSLQTAGVPAISRGNVIVLPDAEVGVAEACSGLRMLVAFAALVMAGTMFLGRGWTDNTVLFLSIVPIAVVVNAWRVVVVSLATQYAPDWADTVHDVAGLMMMILAAAILWALLKFMDALFEDPESSRNVISRTTAAA